MVKVTCQYTGLQFEAKTARSKNHPTIARLLEDANKKGVYGQVIDALVTAKNAGLVGEAVIEAGQVALKSGLKASAQWAAAWRAEQKEKAARESERIARFTPAPRKDEEQLEQEAIREFRHTVTFASVSDTEQ